MAAAAIQMILTRPEGANERFATALSEQVRSRVTIIESPLITITPVPYDDHPAPEAAIFTSANGVRFAPNGNGRPAFCVGEATQDAAKTRGWAAQALGSDAGSLVTRLMALKPAGTIRHYRGEHTRGEVEDRLRRSGLSVDAQTVYDQRETALSDAAQGALSGQGPVIVPLFSPRTARIFAAQRRGSAPIWVAAMSDAVAAEASELAPDRMITAAEPTLLAMAQAVEKLIHLTHAG